MRLATPGWFTGIPLKLKETSITTKHNMVKKFQLEGRRPVRSLQADRGDEVGCTEKQLLVSGQSGT